MRNPSPPERALTAGFTMVELMIVTIVVAILMAIAIPAFRTFLQNDRQWAQESSLVMAFNAARSEAIKQDVLGGVQVCASADGQTCGGGSWANGWIVLSSVNPNNPLLPPVPIQSVGALPPGTTLTELNNTLSVTYLSNGMLNTQLLAAPVPPAFTMCDSRLVPQAVYMQVSLAGRVLSSSKPGQNLLGGALACP
jgi:prepilin-type N-terminal cleavage/methylation domain-containing protein